MSSWHHAPVHHFTGADTFFITGATYLKQEFYRSRESLDELQAILFAEAQQHGCGLQAWCLLSNHYHLVVRGGDVRKMLSRLHSEAAIRQNARDGTTGRRVWYQYWDKTLTYEGSWLVRLRYTHENAVHHGIVREALQYPWCSASWFERTATASFVQAVRSVKMDRVKIYDDYQSGGFATALR